MKKQKGLTIIQLMLVLFVLGIAGAIVVRVVIDKRCDAESTQAICKNR